MRSYNSPRTLQNKAAMIPAAAPIASPVSTLSPIAAAPLLVLAGAVLVVEFELPPDAVDAGEVAVLVPVPLLVTVPLDAADDAEEIAEDVTDLADDTAVDTVESVLNGRWPGTPLGNTRDVLAPFTDDTKMEMRRAIKAANFMVMIVWSWGQETILYGPSYLYFRINMWALAIDRNVTA